MGKEGRGMDGWDGDGSKLQRNIIEEMGKSERGKMRHKPITDEQSVLCLPQPKKAI